MSTTLTHAGMEGEGTAPTTVAMQSRKAADGSRNPHSIGDGNVDHNNKKTKAAQAQAPPSRQSISSKIRLENIAENIRKYEREIGQQERQREKKLSKLAELASQSASFREEIDRLDDLMDDLLEGETSASSEMKQAMAEYQSAQNTLLSQATETDDAVRELEQEIEQLTSEMEQSLKSKKKFQELEKVAQESSSSDEKVDRILRQHKYPPAPPKADDTASFQLDALLTARNDSALKAIWKHRAEATAREKEAEAQQQEEEDARRIQAVLALKRNLSHISEVDKRKAVEVRKRKEQRARDLEDEQKRLLAAGMNPAKVILEQKQEKKRRQKQRDAQRKRERREAELQQKLEQEAEFARKEATLRASKLRSATMGKTLHLIEATRQAEQNRFNAEATIAIKEEFTAAQKAEDAKQRSKDKQRNKAAIRQRMKKEMETNAALASHTSNPAKNSTQEALLVPHSNSHTSRTTTGPKPADASRLAKRLLEEEAIKFEDNDENDDSDDDEVEESGILHGKAHTLGDGLQFHEHLSIPSLAAPLATDDIFDSTARAQFASSEHLGLWDQKALPTGSTLDERESAAKVFRSNGKPLSTLESKRLAEALERQKTNITKPQVVAGREFKGVPFACKPSTVEFANFDLGETYEVKVTLTNISYSVNSFQVLPSEVDFIDYVYTPSGGLSPGIATELTVVFKPQVNKDWTGQLRLVAQTCEFSLPIACRKKRCAVSLSETTTTVPTVALGEQSTATVQLVNTGALSTQYRITEISAEAPAMPQVEAAPLAGKGQAPNAERSARARSTEDPADMEPEAPSSPNRTPEHQDGQSHDEQEGDDSVAFHATKASVLDEQPANKARTDGEEGESKMEEDEATASDKEGVASDAEQQEPRPRENHASATGIVFDSEHSGILDPHATVELQFLFNPSCIGSYSRTFRVELSDQDSAPLEFTVAAECTQVPVYLEKDAVDLRICQIGRSFSHPVTICNRHATSNFNVHFSVPAFARKYVEMKPRVTLVQAGSSTRSSVLFNPTEDIFRDFGDFANPETCEVQLPITMTADGQALKATLTVCARVTPGDIVISTDTLDFGRVSFNETAVLSLTLTNTSALPQAFAFANCPLHIFIQPGGGFGTLLPFETTSVDVLCSPRRHPHDDDDLVLNGAMTLEWAGVLTGKKIKIKCTGVLPPLRLSTNNVRFATTCCGDERSIRIMMQNVSKSERQFHFGIPESSDYPLTISPTCGTIRPQETIALWVRLHTRQPSPEALQKALAAEALTSADNEGDAEAPTMLTAGGQLIQDVYKKLQPVDHVHLLVPCYMKPSDASASRKSATGKKAVAREIGEERAGPTRDQEVPLAEVNPLGIDLSETAYLNVEAAIVPPLLVVQSNGGSHSHDFGQVYLGEKAYFTFRLLNVSDETLTLVANALDSAGCFCTARALRPVESHGFAEIILAFCPSGARKYYEKFDVQCRYQTVSFRLFGEGIVPTLSLDASSQAMALSSQPLRAPSAKRLHLSATDDQPAQGLLQSTFAALKQPPVAGTLMFFGDVSIQDKSAKATLALTNNGPLPLGFKLAFSSDDVAASPSPFASIPVSSAVQHAEDGHTPSTRGVSHATSSASVMKSPRFVFTEATEEVALVRPARAEADTLNRNGCRTFSVQDAFGTLAPGETQEIVFVFSPDRESLFYRDLVRVHYSRVLPPLIVDVRARTWAADTFLLGPPLSTLPLGDNNFITSRMPEVYSDSALAAATSKKGGKDGKKKAAPSSTASSQLSGDRNTKRINFLWKISEMQSKIAAVTTHNRRASMLASTMDAESSDGKKDGHGHQQHESVVRMPLPCLSSTVFVGVPLDSRDGQKKPNGECVVQPFSAEDVAKGFELQGPSRLALVPGSVAPIKVVFNPLEMEEHLKRKKTGNAQDRPLSEKTCAAKRKGTAGSDTQRETSHDNEHGPIDIDGNQSDEKNGDGDDGAVGDNGHEGEGGEEDIEEDDDHSAKLVPGMRVNASTVVSLKAGSSSSAYTLQIVVSVVE